MPRLGCAVSLGLRAPPVVAALTSVALGVAVLFAGALGVEALKDVLPGFDTLKPSTAIAFCHWGPGGPTKAPA